jgi:hypothetical protein
VTCMEPAPPPSCHGPRSHTDTPDDPCSHDHAGHVARLVDAPPLVAVIPGAVIFSPPAARIDLVVSSARAVAGCGSPVPVLRV